MSFDQHSQGPAGSADAQPAPPSPGRTEAVPVTPGSTPPPRTPQTPQPPQPPQPPYGYQYGYPPPPPPRKKSSGLLVGLIVGGLCLLMVVGFVGLVGLAAVAGQSQAGHTYIERTLSEGNGTGKIVVIKVDGVIMDMPAGLFGGGGNVVDSTVKQLRAAAGDDTVAAVILDINSPGGTVTGSDIIYHEVKKLKNQGIKVVAHMRDVCASGGYYISAPADTIIAQPTTITGSIGVIMNFMNMQDLYEQKLGIRSNAITSGPHKDIGSEARPMTPEERKILQTMVNDMYNRFLDIVIEGRTGHAKFPEDRTEVVAIADGRIYLGPIALEKGLVDKVGYQEDAFAEARELAGQPNAKIVQYKSQPSLMDALSGNVEGGGVNINAGVQVDLQRLRAEFAPRFEYRWAPGY